MSDLIRSKTNKNFKDLSGKRFGSLLVIEYSGYRSTPSGTKKYYFLCQCDCGVKKYVPSVNLLNGKSTSCGCYNRSAECRSKHGRSKDDIYRIWSHIKQRCFVETCDCYYRYGGRGITMCDEWKNDFAKFASDMGERPSPQHTVDRKDNNGNYCKENCRWATRTEQQSNMRSNVMVSLGGDKVTVSEAARRIGILKSTIATRMRRGWSEEKALSTPVVPRKNRS
jgi:hypothetical protein